MGALRLKPQENEREIFLSGPRLSYVSHQPSKRPVSSRAHREGRLRSTLLIKTAHSFPSVLKIQDSKSEEVTCFLFEIQGSFLAVKEKTGPERKSPLWEFEGQNPEYAYFFTGKELYEDEALQWYDYGARMYDVKIGRWTTHDPMYQMATPYGYCGNNPVMYHDPDGRLFGVDDLIAAGIGFAVGYVGTGIRTGNWGGKALLNGLIGAGVGVLALNTGGAILAGGGTAFGASLGGGMVGGMAMGAWNGSQMKGGDPFENVMMGMTMGAMTGAISGAAGSAVGGLWTPNTFGGMLLNAAAGGAAGGAIGGAFSSGVYGGNFWEGVGMGAAIGAGTAMVSASGNRLGSALKKEICMRESAAADGYAPNDPVPATAQELEKILNDPSFRDDFIMSDTKGKWEIVKNLRSENEIVLGKTIHTKDYRGVEKVQISNRAFVTYRKLYNTIGHEMVHVTDFTSGNFRGWYDKQLRMGVGTQAAYNHAHIERRRMLTLGTCFGTRIIHGTSSKRNIILICIASKS